MKQLASVIMAAGKGTRMKDPTKAKVMYEVLGKPMIHYVLDVAFALHSHRVVVITGYQREAVMSYIKQSHPSAELVVQAEQLGTGHAMMQTRDALKNYEGDIVVLSGDVPLLTVQSMQQLIDHQRTTNASATILTAEYSDPTGYGRIVRNIDGSVKKIVEQKDATDAERQIREINSGIYVFDREKLFEGLSNINSNNAQKEYYLTDVFEYFWKHQWKVAALKAEHPEEIQGVNTLEQLAEVQSVLLQRQDAST
ncbi:MAG TPA: sugar phosphate nucleotidyltransferase [Bacteroidota bacterium]|nr:sugar phosphate nucleotidyltransferase [Bacteroidota bacterium]